MLIELRDVIKEYSGVKVINNLSLEIQPGTFLAVLGPSGSGKTTFLRLLAGLIKPDSGAILFDRKVVNDLLPPERKVAMVFQKYALYPLSVEKNLSLPLKAQGLSKDKIQEKIDNIAELLTIKKLLKRKVMQLSGGEQQRVALGRAIIREPNLFLLDEPLSNLDASLKQHIKKELKQLHFRLNITSIMVTHDQSEAMALGQQVMIIDNGNLIQLGTPDEIYSQPNNKFVAEFIGVPKMNLIEGEMQDIDGQILFIAPKLRQAVPRERFRGQSASSNKQVWLGIRPEDVSLTHNGGLAGKVEYIERSGGDWHLTVKTDAAEITVRTVLSQRINMDDSVNLKFNENALFIFDSETKKNLSL